MNKISYLTKIHINEKYIWKKLIYKYRTIIKICRTKNRQRDYEVIIIEIQRYLYQIRIKMIGRHNLMIEINLMTKFNKKYNQEIDRIYNKLIFQKNSN